MNIDLCGTLTYVQRLVCVALLSVVVMAQPPLHLEIAASSSDAVAPPSSDAVQKIVDLMPDQSRPYALIQ